MSPPTIHPGPAGPPGGPPAAPTGRPILIIDDERDLAEGCRRALAAAGYRAEVAADARDGLRRARDGDADAVLLDLKMPDLSGAPILETLHRDRPDLPVVIITGYGSAETATHTHRLGAAGFLAKPFTPVELVEAVARALARAGVAADDKTRDAAPLGTMPGPADPEEIR